MSVGNFTRSFYSSNKTGLVHPIRIQPETLTLTVGGVTNTAAAGPATSPLSAQVSQGKRSLGLNARTVTIKILGAGASGYQVGGTISLPWLAGPAAFDAMVNGAAVTYQGATGELVGTSAETAK